MTVLANAPDHWTRTTIGEIADVRLGRQRSPKNHHGTHMRPYLRAANVDWYRLRLDDVAEMNFTDDEMGTYQLQDGDILIVEGSGSATEVGKCAIYRGEVAECAFQNTLIRVRPHPGIDSRWLMYRINAEAELGGFLRLARGVGIFHLGAKRTAKWPVAVPSLPEQQALVAALEQRRARTAKGLESLHAVLTKAQLLQESAKSAAIYGRLHSTRRDAADSLTAVAAARQAAPRATVSCDEPDVLLPPSWTWASLDEIADVQSGAAKSKKLNNQPDCTLVPYLSVANVQRGYLDLTEVGEMWAKTNRLPALTLQAGDILFNEGGDKDKLGRGWVWDGSRPGCIHQNHVFRARLRTSKIDPRWVSHWGNVFGRWWFHDRASQTTGIASINKTVLRSLPVAVPPIDEQIEILDLLARHESAARHALSTAATAARRVGVLDHSILRSAFSGGSATADLKGSTDMEFVA